LKRNAAKVANQVKVLLWNDGDQLAKNAVEFP
jgi:hypothetical protein